MIGQSSLMNTVNSLVDSNSFPRTVLLEGEWGCGKHTLASYIAEKLHVELYDITDSLDLDTLQQIALSATARLYLIDATMISVKEQNTILKFLEEPLKNSFIVLLVENKTRLLNTVVNRCMCWSFEQYTEEELKTFTEGDLPRYANTPGRVKKFSELPISEMCGFAEKVLMQVHISNYSNILTIPNRINFKEDANLFDFDIFSYILINSASKLYSESKIPYAAYDVTSRFFNDCYIPHINKRHLFENYLFRLKQVVSGGV